MWIPLRRWRYFACAARLARIGGRKVLGFFWGEGVKHETTRNGTLLNWSVKYLSPELSLGAIEIVGFPGSVALSGVVLIKLNYVGGNQRQISAAVHCAGRCKAITQTRLRQPPCLFADDQRQGRLAVSPSNCMLITPAVERDTHCGQICPHRRKVI